MFLVDFFSDSPATAEWRVLMSYLHEVEDEFQEKGIKGIPTGHPLQQVQHLLWGQAILFASSGGVSANRSDLHTGAYRYAQPLRA